MLSTDPIVGWDSEKASQVIAFLKTEAGQHWLELVKSLKPLHASSNETNDIVRQHGRQEGYDQAIHNLLFTVTPEFMKPQDTPAESYPPLEDDKAWKDQ